MGKPVVVEIKKCLDCISFGYSGEGEQWCGAGDFEIDGQMPPPDECPRRKADTPENCESCDTCQFLGTESRYRDCGCGGPCSCSKGYDVEVCLRYPNPVEKEDNRWCGEWRVKNAR